MKNNKLVIVLFLVIVLLVIVLACVYYAKNSTIKDNNTENNQNIANSENELNNITKPDTELIMIEAFLNYIEKCASTGYVIKGIDGEVTASKLTLDEYKANRQIYKNKLKGILNNKFVVLSSYEKNGKTCYIYSPTKLLEILDLSTHMGVGLGLLDSNGNKVYIVGEEINSYGLVSFKNSNIITGFGYNTELFITNILNFIEKCADSGHIIKDLNGEVTAPKLTVAEAKVNRQIYKNKIFSELNNTEIFTKIYLEDNTLKCKYKIEGLLNSLELSSHMGMGLESDEEGYKIFSW